MKNEKEYLEHIKESWNFATKTAQDELKQKNHTATNLALYIFEKCVSPYHYFVKDKNDQEPNELKPTERQIEYAKKLGIEKPETYTRKTLSEAIDEAKNK